MRRAWIEIQHGLLESPRHLSLSMRRAWIEILPSGKERLYRQVALHAESVDRNVSKSSNIINSSVALHAESVDRNFCLFFGRAKIPRRSPCGERG